MTSEYLKIAGAVILPNLGGICNSRQVTRANLENWYYKLKFPSYRPPNWVFGPVWTSLYSGMGYASYLVWRDGGGFSKDNALPLTLYASQLALNWAWTPIFFGKHNIKGGLIDIAALTVTAAGCGFAFYKVNNIAGYIFIPYLAWLGFATALNYSIYKLNPENEKSSGEDKSE